MDYVSILSSPCKTDLYNPCTVSRLGVTLDTLGESLQMALKVYISIHYGDSS